MSLNCVTCSAKVPEVQDSLSTDAVEAQDLPTLCSVWDDLRFHKECQTDSVEREHMATQTSPSRSLETTASTVTAPSAPTITEVLTSDESMSACAGLTSLLQFQKICECVAYIMLVFQVTCKWKLDIPSQVLLTLMKIKLNLSFRCLACYFHITPKCARENFYYMVDVLHSILKQFVVWLPKETIEGSMPVYFMVFTDTRVCLDCAEIPVQKSKCLNCSVRMYSHYKGRHTVKFMIGISPSGVITFVSKVYGGRASDKFIFKDSKVLELCGHGDAVMVDQGFAIETECDEADVKLYRPPFFFKENEQYKTEEVVMCRRIARARVHVERVIQRIRLFKILLQQLDWSLLECIDKILVIVCELVNLSPSVLGDKRFIQDDS